MVTLRRLSAYLRPHLRLLLQLAISMACGLGAELLLPRVVGLIIDRGIATKSMPIVVRYIGLLAMIAVFRACSHFSWGYSQERIGQEVIRSLRRELFVRLQRLSFAFYNKNNTGDLMSRVTSDVNSVMEFFGFGLAEMISCTLMFTGTVTVLLLADWQLGLVVLLPIPVLMLVVYRFSSIIGPAWERIRKEMGNLSTTLQENISGVRVVKSFARESHEIGKFSKRNKDALQANLVRANIEARTFPVINFITGFCFLLLYWYGGRRVYDGDMTLGTFFSFNWYLWGLIWPIRFLGYLINVARKAIAAGPRVFEIRDSQMEIPEVANAREMPAITGHVRFEDVHFAFEDGDGTPVLRNLNLDIQPGQIVAVLGGTGSGKSSVINLIPRFFDVQQGRVTIDGVDTRDVTLDSLRGQIGIVPQETFLFSDTVRNNIAFGRPDATQEEVEEAAKAAQAHDFIMALPRGYETRVGERGIGLSGGQKQRIAIARALLTNPRILILDEATSSVDAETEHALQVALNRLMQGRTSLVIAQRLSTVKNAHKVVVIKDGAVVEEGTHDELLQRGGEYTEIYRLQLRPREDLV